MIDLPVLDSIDKLVVAIVAILLACAVSTLD